MSSDVPDGLAQVAESIKASGVNLLLNRFEIPPYVHITHLYVPEDMRGAGVGTNALKSLCQAADREGHTLGISPRDEFGADVARFDALCERFGFQPLIESWPNGDFRPRLIRYPKHGDRSTPPPGRGWTWHEHLRRWVWKSYPDLQVGTKHDGSLRYMGWDAGAQAGKGEWYELPEFERTDWVFQYRPRFLGWGPRALTRAQCNAAMRDDYENGFYLRSWQVEDRDMKPMWIGFMFGASTGRVLRMYEYIYSTGETPAG